jgi:hypothetical protein
VGRVTRASIENREPRDVSVSFFSWTPLNAQLLRIPLFASAAC